MTYADLKDFHKNKKMIKKEIPGQKEVEGIGII